MLFLCVLDLILDLCWADGLCYVLFVQLRCVYCIGFGIGLLILAALIVLVTSFLLCAYSFVFLD